jgi:multicomponent Na+:H+ antiporter subunit E
MDFKKLGLYLLFWLILAQTLNLERIVVGTFICISVYAFNKNLHETQNENYNLSFSNIKNSLLYVAVLIIEIFKSNFHVAKIVLTPKLNISTSIVTISTKLKNDMNKTILANSITLTPGTLTLDMNQDKLVIHCLDAEAAKGLENISFEGILLKREELI